VINIKLQPNPVKIYEGKPINKAETKPFSEVNASPIAALYPGVSGGPNIIATNKPIMIVKLSRDKKTVTEVVRDPL